MCRAALLAEQEGGGEWDPLSSRRRLLANMFMSLIAHIDFRFDRIIAQRNCWGHERILYTGRYNKYDYGRVLCSQGNDLDYVDMLRKREWFRGCKPSFKYHEKSLHTALGDKLMMHSLTAVCVNSCIAATSRLELVIGVLMKLSVIEAKYTRLGSYTPAWRDHKYARGYLLIYFVENDTVV